MTRSKEVTHVIETILILRCDEHDKKEIMYWLVRDLGKDATEAVLRREGWKFPENES